MYRSQIQKVALLPSAYNAGCSQYLKIFVWAVSTRVWKKNMLPGRSYSGPYIIPGRSWQDHSKANCMICMVRLYGQIMIGLVGKPGVLQFEFIYLSFPFLVGAFSFKEKSPTITVASFFFVRPQSSSRMYHFLQKLISSLRPSSTNANLLQRVPPFVFHLFS